MKEKSEIKFFLQKWMIEKNEKVNLKEFSHETPLIEKNIISSLQVMELILLIEQLRGKPITPESLKAGAFYNVNTIIHHFFEDDQ